MQFGRSLPRTPCSDGALPSVTVIGKPVRAWKMPLTLQPPRIASTSGETSEPYVRPRPNGSS